MLQESVRQSGVGCESDERHCTWKLALWMATQDSSFRSTSNLFVAVVALEPTKYEYLYVAKLVVYMIELLHLWFL